MKKLLLILFVYLNFNAAAQCIKGNCTMGIGTYDFSWCVYTGEFKNGKPNGKGSMKYDDYTYKGEFLNGLEDGVGVITNKNGTVENVSYKNGIKQEGYHLEKIAAADYKPLVVQDVNCISGDCINGYGTYVWASGNKYIGNWKNYKREGAGNSSSPAGDKFIGTWHNNEKVEGSYTFPNGAVYVGTYKADGKELNGTISLRDTHIPFVNGEARIPPAPEIAKEEKQGNNGKNGGVLTVCRTCYGSGSVTDRIVTTTYSETTHYKSCPKCGGRGMWME